MGSTHRPRLVRDPALKALALGFSEVGLVPRIQFPSGVCEVSLS